VSFSTFWHAKGGLQMCVFLGRAMNFIAPPPWIRHCALDAWNWHGTDVTAVELQSHRIASQSRHAQL